MPLCAVSDAQAQNCAPSITNGVNTSSIAGAAASVAANVVASVVAANTAFLSQSTVFVSAPPNPQSGQPGGGLWTRGVGGQVDVSSNSSSSLSLQAPPGNALATASQPCSTTVRSSFSGVQLGADISRLNINGWDIHLGATAGSLYTKNTVLGGSPVGSVFGAATTTQVPFDSSSQVPFIGGYAAVVNGGFFADFLVRADAYQMNLNSPRQNFYGQNLSARGLAVGGSVGYNYQIPGFGSWFVEPSAGFLYSNVRVDALNMAGNAFTFGTPTAGLLSGTETFADITEAIGRLGLRVGTSLSYGSLELQPFAAVSVWHDFAGNINANWSSTPGLLTCDPCVPRSTGLLTASYSGTNIGTFGQYSVGVAGTLPKTGWVGFVRGDYRNGPNLTGWDATGGLRYEFSPNEMVSTAFPVKAPTAKAPALGPAIWNGFYVGGFGGAQLGWADWSYQVGSARPRTGGTLGGIDVGYNWQNGSWVFGIKGDWTWTDDKGGTACGPMSLVPLTATVATPYSI